MEVVKGVVEQISIKERKTGQYGDFAAYGIKVGGNWHNGMANADKHSGEIVVKDKDFKEVKVGMEVEFVVEEKKGYQTINNKLFTIKSGAEPVLEQRKPLPQETKKEDVKVDKTDIAVYLSCMETAAIMASGTTFQVGDKDPEKFSTDMVIRMADHLYKKAIEHATFS